MADEFVTCSLCGFEFEPQDTLCSHGCPLGAMCGLIRCPSCEYEFPRTPRGVTWVERLLRRSPSPVAPSGPYRSVQDLAPAQRAVVRCVGSSRAGRPNRLAVFGLVPGAEITVLQQHPSCVLRVGETDLALDRAIAREIVVEPVDGEPATR